MTRTYSIKTRSVLDSVKALCDKNNWGFEVVAAYWHGATVHWTVQVTR